MNLEERLPPLNLAYLSDNLDTASKHDRTRMVSILNRCIVDCRAQQIEYLKDVIYLACRAHCALMSAADQQLYNTYTVASLHAEHVGCDHDELKRLVMRNATTGVTPEAAALYRYTLAVQRGNFVQTHPIADAAGTEKLMAIVAGYGAECKFQRTGDLFIWAIVQLRCPAWTCAALAAKERPYEVASLVHTDNTNLVVHPLLTTAVSKLLHTLHDNELFCVVAAIAIEMAAGTKMCLLINSQLLSADPQVPTLAAIKAPFEINGATDVCGYMLHGDFHIASTPEQAVLSWAKVYKPDGFLAKIVSTAEDEVPLDNPFSKFL